jgi:AcrR family transcriptional regulator
MNERSFTLAEQDRLMKHRTAAEQRPAQRKPQARGEVTRERLLDVALDQFVRHGYHGTSMRQIAGAAGMAVGGIYNHYGSKEEVFAAVLDANHPYRLVEGVLQDVKANNLESFISETSVRMWTAVQGREGQLLPLMFIEVVEFQGRHLRAVAESIFPRVLGVVQRFEQSAESRRALSSLLMLRTFIGLMIGHLIVDATLGRSPMFAGMNDDWLAGEVDIFLHGVLSDERRMTKDEG